MKHTRPSLHQRITSRLRSGFSLVEVTLSTGITAVAITSILGLVPQGLSHVREAGNLNAQSNITQHLLGSVSQSPWMLVEGRDSLADKFHEKRFFFDDQGIEIPEAEAREGGWLAYVAEVQVPPQDFVIPASGSSALSAAGHDPYLRRVTVRVAGVADPDFDFKTGSRLATRTHTSLIARSGR